MPFDFPSAPTNGQVVTGPGGIQYRWDTVKWTAYPLPNLYAPINAPVFTGDAQAVTPPVADADTSIATTAFVQSAAAPYAGNVGRNLLHNGLFNVQQRGQGPWWSGGDFTADRWWVGSSLDTSSADILAQSTPEPNVNDDAMEWYLTNTFTGNAGASSFTVAAQSIEDVRRLSGKTVIVSFWALSAPALRFGVSFVQHWGSGGSPSVHLNGQSVQLTGSWARYSLTFTLPDSSGQTVGGGGDDNTQLFFFYSTGSDNAAGSGHVGVQSGTINLWGVQLEIAQPGQTQPTPLEKLDPRIDLANCQRFYVSGLEVLVSQVLSSGNWGGSKPERVNFPVTMRAAPTVTPRYLGGSPDPGTAVTAVGPEVCYIYALNAMAAVGDYANYDITASADL